MDKEYKANEKWADRLESTKNEFLKEVIK